MFRRKKKRMIDIRKLHAQGKIRSPGHIQKDVATNGEGFVEVGSNKDGQSISQDSIQSLIDTTTSQKEHATASFTTQQEGYSKREVDEHIQKLDTLLYKLEQRIELLEKKMGISSKSTAVSSSSSGNLIGW